MSNKPITAREPRVMHCDDMPIGIGWYCTNHKTGEMRRYINKGKKPCQT